MGHRRNPVNHRSTSHRRFPAFDGAARHPQEARRIVDILRDSDQAPGDLLEVLTFRRADGSEVSLREFPMAQLLSAAETVRAEEIVLRVADGRQATVLLNATPIRSDGGAVESVVVTMQDLAEVEKLERLRADFLAMVTHELRMPLTSIRGSAITIMDAAPELGPAVVRQFVRIMGDQADRMNVLVSDLLANAARHSAPGSVIRVSAAHDGVHVALSVSDEGRGDSGRGPGDSGRAVALPVLQVLRGRASPSPCPRWGK